MENNNMNVQTVIDLAVNNEKAEAAAIRAEATTEIYKDLYEEAKAKADAPKLVELRITQSAGRKYNYHTEMDEPVFKIIDVRTTDLNDAIALIKKEIEETKDSEIESKDIIIKELKKKLTDLKENLAERIEDVQKEYQKYRKDLMEKLEKKEEKLNKTITDLTKDLEKERENKTEKELELKRLEELASLKTRIQNLETELNELLHLNLFKRIWRWKSIVNLRAKIKAYHQVAENEYEAKKVIDSYVPVSNEIGNNILNGWNICSPW
jgi:chromosome segregation ATPase